MTQESSHLEQNYQEGLLALEQLEAKVEAPGFDKEVRRTEYFFKNLKLEDEKQQELMTRLEEVKAVLLAKRAEATAETKLKVDQALDALADLLVVPEGYIGDIFEASRQRFDEAKTRLETTQELLKTEGRSLVRPDQDAAWQRFKDLRKTYKKVRRQTSDALIKEAETLFNQAKEAVENTSSLREAREQFKSLQRAVNELPLWRQQRQVFRKRFNELWQTLQDRSKAFRSERQQRQSDGLQRLEEALERVNQLVKQKTEAVEFQEERLNQAHWSEVDPIERQFNREERDLKSALRRQKELTAKIEDARKRLAKQTPAEAKEEVAEAVTEAVAEATEKATSEDSTETSEVQATEESVEESAESVEKTPVSSEA